MPYTPFIPTGEHLINGLDHVFYEINQLVETDVGLSYSPLSDAILEAKLLHSRILLDFFERIKRTKDRSNKCENDDMLCIDYKFPAKLINISSFCRKKLNKDLAHLTYSRNARTPDDKEWPVDDYLVPILKRCLEFIDHIISFHISSQIEASSRLVDLRNKVASCIQSNEGSTTA